MVFMAMCPLVQLLIIRFCTFFLFCWEYKQWSDLVTTVHKVTSWFQLPELNRALPISFAVTWFNVLSSFLKKGILFTVLMCSLYVKLKDFRKYLLKVAYLCHLWWNVSRKIFLDPTEERKGFVAFGKPHITQRHNQFWQQAFLSMKGPWHIY